MIGEQSTNSEFPYLCITNQTDVFLQHFWCDQLGHEPSIARVDRRKKRNCLKLLPGKGFLRFPRYRFFARPPAGSTCHRIETTPQNPLPKREIDRGIYGPERRYDSLTFGMLIITKPRFSTRAPGNQKDPTHRALGPLSNMAPLRGNL